MLNRQFIVFCSLLVISFMFFAVATVNAQEPPLAPALSAPYTCTLEDSKGNSVTIEAGPDGGSFSL